MELSDRQQRILQVIVEEYISTVHPVASENIAARSGLGVKPATVRNEMAELEAAGLITHPHTSAGRVPSDKGYRYFVENLLDSSISLPSDEQRTIQHQFHQVQGDIEKWMRLSTAVLSRAVQNAAIITEPKGPSVTVKQCQLLSLQDRTALLILITSDGTVRQTVLTLADPLAEEELTTVGNKLTALLRGKSLAVLPMADHDLSQFEREVEAQVVILLHTVEDFSVRDITYDGLVKMLNQPEFRATERVKQVIELLENGGVLLTILPDVLNQDGVQVIIGDENKLNDLRQCSIILTRYGVDEKAGVLGIIGPTRMEYGRTISGVRYVARLLSEMMRDVYGN